METKTEYDFLDKYDPQQKILFPNGSRHNGQDLPNEWVSKKDLLVCIEKLKNRFFLTMIDGSQETNKTDTFDAHTYINEELIDNLTKR